MVTSGPGVLNALNALASAHLEGLPVLLIAGEAPRARRPGLATAEGLGARAIRITGPDQLTQLDLAELAKEAPSSSTSRCTAR